MEIETFTKEETERRKALGISRIRDLVESREWLWFGEIRRDIMLGYSCNIEQARALLQIGLANGYIEFDQEAEKYRITEA